MVYLLKTDIMRFTVTRLSSYISIRIGEHIVVPETDKKYLVTGIEYDAQVLKDDPEGALILPGDNRVILLVKDVSEPHG